MKKEWTRRVCLVVCALLAAGAFAACSEGVRESDENVGTEPPPDAGVMEAAGEEPAPEGPGGVEMGDPEVEEEAEPTLNERAAAAGRMGGEPEKGDEGEGEHEEGGEEGDRESDDYIGASETWDERVGSTRLLLAFDEGAGAFVGTVQNVTRAALCGVRVEVHLSTGTELGPTPATDLPATQTLEVELPSGGESFDGYTAHVETSACEG